MRLFKLLLVSLLLILSIFFYDCGTKKGYLEEFEKKLNKNLKSDEIKLATYFGKVIKVEKLYTEVKLKKDLLETFKALKIDNENYIYKIFNKSCLSRGGSLEIKDKKLDKKVSDIIYNRLQATEFPDVYLREYFKNDYILNSLIVKKYYQIPENTILFCYLPDTKRFFSILYDKDKNIIRIYRGSVLEVIPKYTEEESKKLKDKIQKIINQDLENLVWFSLNLPLMYRGVKLYYFEARPVYETEEDKKAKLGTDRWNVYLKFKNESFKPYILNIGRITLLKEGRDYKPLFKIDDKGNIKGVIVSGDCERIEGNKVIIGANGKCNIYYIYDTEKKEGGLKFIGLKNLKGAVLSIDNYPIYIWSMTAYDMKIEGLSVEEK